MGSDGSSRRRCRPRRQARTGFAPCCRVPSSQKGCSFLQKIRIFAVLVDIGFDEGTLRNHFHAFAAHLIECTLDQLRADPLATEFRRNFGVNEGDHAIVDLVIGRGEMTFDREFETMMRLVVDDFSHGMFSSWTARPSINRMAWIWFKLKTRATSLGVYPARKLT